MTRPAGPETPRPDDWDERVDRFWSTADDSDPEAALAGMRALVDERPEADAAARYEWASVHDFLGREAEAVPLYLAALDAGLDEVRRPQAVVQLASSLRNTGAAAEVVELLRAEPTSPVTGEASAAFLALALYDAGRPAEALQTALRALVPTLPLYRGALTRYVDELDA